MNFGILMYLISVMMKWGMLLAAWLDSDFAKLLKKRNFSILMMTKNRKYGRCFIFKDGKISSQKGVHHQADLRFIWKDGKTAIRIMKKGNDQIIFMDAVTDGDLLFEGSAAAMMRFILLTTRMMDVYKKKAGKKFTSGRKSETDKRDSSNRAKNSWQM